MQGLISIVDGKVILEKLDLDILAAVRNVASLYIGDKRRVNDEGPSFTGNRLLRFSFTTPGRKSMGLDTETQAAVNGTMSQVPCGSL